MAFCGEEPVDTTLESVDQGRGRTPSGGRGDNGQRTVGRGTYTGIAVDGLDQTLAITVDGLDQTCFIIKTRL